MDTVAVVTVKIGRKTYADVFDLLIGAQNIIIL